jgi:hypothetical protein
MGTLFLRSRRPLSVGFAVDQGGQEDVAEPVETERIEIIVGEVELEPPAKASDALLEFIPAQGGNGRRQLIELPIWLHGCDLW